MREVTEKPESVLAGWVELVGNDKNLIIEKIKTLLLDEGHYKKMQMVINPYGDGKASSHICNTLMQLTQIIIL